MRHQVDTLPEGQNVSPECKNSVSPVQPFIRTVKFRDRVTLRAAPAKCSLSLDRNQIRQFASHFLPLSLSTPHSENSRNNKRARERDRCVGRGRPLFRNLKRLLDPDDRWTDTRFRGCLRADTDRQEGGQLILSAEAQSGREGRLRFDNPSHFFRMPKQRWHACKVQKSVMHNAQSIRV